MVVSALCSAALAYLDRGWSVFPLEGKHAKILWKQYQTERPTREQVVEWWTEWPDAGIGVALGRVSGVVRVDCDGEEAVQEFQRLGAPDTLEFTTPSGGRGYLYKYLEGVVTETVWKGPGEHQELRVQSDGAYTVVPPSRHPNGGFYEWINERALHYIPDWVHDRAVERVLRDLVKELRPTLRQPDRSEVIEALDHIPADEYDTWIQVGMALHSIDDLALWVKWSSKSCKFVEGECERKWASFNSIPGGLTTRSILHWAEREDGWRPVNRHEPLTDLGNARVLARVADGMVCHSAKWGWMKWTGVKWTMEEAEKAVVEFQKQALEHRLNKAVESLARHLKTDQAAPDFDAKRKQKMNTIVTIRKHEDEGHIRGARALAQSEPDLSADYKEFDTDPWLLNCQNGVLDLRTGELKGHDRGLRLTQLCPTDYDPSAKCPTWVKFFEDILPDSDVRHFVRLFLGCCLTGDVTAQMMPVFWGGGANGKSTLIGTVMHVLGVDYAMKSKRDMLMVKRNSDHPTSIARLYRKRFVACIESGEEGRLDETLVKELTGGDTIAARRMREDEWEFEPTHKPILVTNHKPEVRGTDEAIWRRLPLVPFLACFPVGDPRRIGNMGELLQAESVGILAWMVEGCNEWYKNNRELPRPKAVQAATEEYRGEQDRIGLFLQECCTRVPGSRTRTEELMRVYTMWCVTNKHRQLDGRAFGRAMTEKGYQLDDTRKFRLDLEIQRPGG